MLVVVSISLAMLISLFAAGCKKSGGGGGIYGVVNHPAVSAGLIRR
jgi:hypothetical protein